MDFQKSDPAALKSRLLIARLGLGTNYLGPIIKKSLNYFFFLFEICWVPLQGPIARSNLEQYVFVLIWSLNFIICAHLPEQICLLKELYILGKFLSLI